MAGGVRRPSSGKVKKLGAAHFSAVEPKFSQQNPAVYIHVDLPFYVSPFFDTISCWPVGGRRQAAAATFTLPCFILGLHVYVSCGQDQRGAERRSPLGSVLVRSKHIASTRHKAVFSILDVFMSRDPYLFDCFGLSNSSFICD